MMAFSAGLRKLSDAWARKVCHEVSNGKRCGISIRMAVWVEKSCYLHCLSMERHHFVEKPCLMLMLSMETGCFVEKGEIADRAGNDLKGFFIEKGIVRAGRS